MSTGIAAACTSADATEPRMVDATAPRPRDPTSSTAARDVSAAFSNACHSPRPDFGYQWIGGQPELPAERRAVFGDSSATSRQIWSIVAAKSSNVSMPE